MDGTFFANGALVPAPVGLALQAALGAVALYGLSEAAKGPK